MTKKWYVFGESFVFLSALEEWVKAGGESSWCAGSVVSGVWAKRGHDPLSLANCVCLEDLHTLSTRDIK